MERSRRLPSRSSNSCFLSPKDAVVCRHFFICILFVAIVHLTLINANSGNSPSYPEVCHSEECFRSEAVFKQNMDLSVDPCDDFYSYACGHWADNYSPAKRRETHNWSNVQQNKIDRMILDHLEADTSRSDSKPVAQAKIMYNACLKNLEAVDNRDRFKVIQKNLKKFELPTIPTLLLEHGKEPKQDYKFDWIRSVAKIKRNLGFNIMIGLSFAPDVRDMDRVRPGYFKQLELIEFPMHVWLQPKNHTSRTQNEKSQKSDSEAYMKDVQQNVDPNSEKIEKTFNSIKKILAFDMYKRFESSELVTLAEQLEAFHKQLPVLDDESEEEEPMYYTVAELQNITDSHIAPRKPYPVWQHYLDVLFADLPDNKPAAHEKLPIEPKNVKYLCDLVDFISKQSPDHIELFIWKTVIERLVDHRYNNLKTEEECKDYVQELMDLAVTYAISDKNFLNETKPRVEQLFNDIQSEFHQMVRETKWIDALTKNALAEKSKAMEVLIGYPEWMLNADKLEEHYRGLEVDRYRHFENWVNALQIVATEKLQLFNVNPRKVVFVVLKEVIAHDAKPLNLLYFPGGRLQYPFYHHGLEALNYAALGYTMGRKLTHNFDDSGRFFGDTGSYEKVWSNHSLQRFDERASCLVKQYDSYYVPEAKSYISGILTHKENIADNGGILEAFRAYRSYVKRNGPEPLLPGFEDFTHEQLFFISFGNQHCETPLPIEAEELLESTHSPAKFRVLGVLSNMEEFSEAFQCPRGSKMNPEKKCHVW